MDSPAVTPTPTPASTPPAKARLPWSIVHTIKNELYCVEISRLNLRLPKYSYKILSLSKDKKTDKEVGIPFISLILESVDIGSVRIRGSHPSELLYNLMQQAEEWVITTAALAIQEDRIEREMQQANRDRQVTRQTGKTERERQKRATR